jgi:hypothetical protein
MSGQRYKWSIELFENLKSKVSRKSTALIAAAALLFAGVSAQASGFLNTPAGGYLVCVDTKTGAVTHPGTSKCKKGQKRLVLGAQGPAGATGANGQDGLVGASGLPGNNGNTLWTGNGEPSNTLGIPGDSYLDLAGKKIHAPKASDGTWPMGISIVGPQGPQGPGGSGPAGPAGPAGSQGPAGVSAPVATGTNCIGTKCTYKVGDTGPGGGKIFFVDYHDNYEEFNYLEIAKEGWAQEWYENFNWNTVFEEESETVKAAIFPNGSMNDPLMEWCSYSGSPVGEDFFPGEDPDYQSLSWLLSAAGRGEANTTIALEAACEFGAVNIADEYESTGKDDWFLPSIGELMLAYTNMRQLGFSSFVSKETLVDKLCYFWTCQDPQDPQDYFKIEAAYWSSTLADEYTAFHQHFDTGAQTAALIGYDNFVDIDDPFSARQYFSYVRPIRSF